jgi:hypothetical protein
MIQAAGKEEREIATQNRMISNLAQLMYVRPMKRSGARPVEEDLTNRCGFPYS